MHPCVLVALVCGDQVTNASTFPHWTLESRHNNVVWWVKLHGGVTVNWDKYLCCGLPTKGFPMYQCALHIAKNWRDILHLRRAVRVLAKPVLDEYNLNWTKESIYADSTMRVQEQVRIQEKNWCCSNRSQRRLLFAQTTFFSSPSLINLIAAKTGCENTALTPSTWYKYLNTSTNTRFLYCINGGMQDFQARICMGFGQERPKGVFILKHT